MRELVNLGAWVGGAMLISASLMVLCQHAEAERTRAALQATQAHVDKRIRILDARLTDMQAETNRKKLASISNPPLDPKRLVKASQELDRLIDTAAPPAGDPTMGDELIVGPASVPVEGTVEVAAEGGGDRVYVAAGGRWYHKPGCKRVQKAMQPIPRAEAERRGRTRCSTCQP